MVEPVRLVHVPLLAAMLNEIIELGGTTAFQEEFSDDAFVDGFIAAGTCICCFVAVDRQGAPAGFQALTRHPALPRDWGDIATFVRVGATGQGVGSALFARTARFAGTQALAAINATIRADNIGGLRYYDRMGFETFRIDHAVPLADGTLVDRISKRFAP